MTIRQEFDTVTVPATNLRVRDVINGRIVQQFVRDSAYDHRYPDEGSRCNYVKFDDGTRAYFDLSPKNLLSVQRAARNV